MQDNFGNLSYIPPQFSIPSTFSIHLKSQEMKFALSFLILSISLSCLGQTAKPDLISASGDHFTSPGKQISWSLGEVITETFLNTEYSVTQGFHQCNYRVTAMDESILIDFDIQVYPNPASDFIRVVINSNKKKPESFLISITDLQGKKLLLFNAAGNSHILSLLSYKPGTYFLSVLEGEKILKTFKIIKSE